jgi:thiamine-phosphate pyrophosphorylase
VTFTRPVLCLVTDRHRLGTRLGLRPDADAALDALVAQVTAAAEAGVHLVQIREPDLPARDLVALARAIRTGVGPGRVPVLVNDRMDVALASGADGVHLKSTSIPADEAASLAPPGFLIGRSVHSVEEILRGDAAGAHYLIFGTVFASRSKPAGGRTAGLAGLAEAVNAASPLPVLGIGGVGRDQAAGIAATGAAGLAAIDAFLPAEGTGIADTVKEQVRCLRIAFDSPYTLSYDGRQ